MIRPVPAALVLSAFSIAILPAAAADIRLGQVSLSFYAVKGEVVRAVLEENGHEVETIERSHADIYPRLGQGEIDLLAASWLPNGHAGLFVEVEGSVEKLTPFYTEARFYCAVPSYVPESDMATVSDLSNLDVPARMADVIATLPPSTGLTIGTERMMDAYGLYDAGYRLRPGSAETWLQSLDGAVERRDWIVLPLWQPQRLNAEFDLRWLDDPRDVYGEDDTACLLAHLSLRDRLDTRTISHLGNIRLPVEAVTEMDRMVNVDSLTPAKAAERWMNTNPDLVASWRP